MDSRTSITQATRISAMCTRLGLLALGPGAVIMAFWLLTHPLVPGVTSPTATWTQLATVCATAGLCGWGLWWSAACLLAGIARARRAMTGSMPAWAERLPRRCLAATGLAATVTLSALAPAHATSHVAVTSISPMVDAEAHEVDPGWPLGRAEQPITPDYPSTPRPSVEEEAPQGTDPPASRVPQTSPAQRASDTPKTWKGPRPSTDLPASLGGSRRAEVIVSPGDTLWGLAADHLGPSASSHDIAQEWPRWFHSNRDVIGSDPHLIIPGTRLLPPDG